MQSASQDWTALTTTTTRSELRKASPGPFGPDGVRLVCEVQILMKRYIEIKQIGHLAPLVVLKEQLLILGTKRLPKQLPHYRLKTLT